MPFTDVERLIVLAPIEPAPTGNGLAMRTALFRRSAPVGLEVSTAVVPVAGRLSPDVPQLPGVVMIPPDPVAARAGVRELLGDAVWRERLSRAGRLPQPARAASAGLADAVAAKCGGPAAAVHVMRSYMAPLGVAVAERLGRTIITLDLDDDDTVMAASRGDPEEAAAYERLLSAFGPLFDGLSAASGAEAETIGQRHGVLVEHLPNAIDLPSGSVSPERRRGPRDQVVLLFVGNLTYPPNAEAACTLVQAILPRAERRLGRPVRVKLVGRHGPELQRLAGPSVELTGFVPDLGPVYASADIVVTPLNAGGGTRIKLLEAFAHGIPVIASPAAAAGLAVSEAHHLLLAETADQAAAAIETIVMEPERASRLIEQARALVQDRYSSDVVVRQIRGFFTRAATRACRQPAALP